MDNCIDQMKYMNIRKWAGSYMSANSFLLWACPGFIVCVLLSACGSRQQEVSNESGPMLIVSGDGDFKDFFNNFSADSAFQEERIKYPLPYFYYEEYADTMSINEIDMGDWRYINFANDTLAKTKKTDAYDITLEQLDTATTDYTRSGIDNGIFITYTFHKEAGHWYLTKIMRPLELTGACTRAS